MDTMAPERSRTLHNFSLPSRLNWGAQRLLRCSKVNPNECDHDRKSELTSRSRREALESETKRRSFHEPESFKNSALRSPPVPTVGRNFRIGGEGDGNSIEMVREKLMLDLHKEVDKMKVSILCNGEKDIPPPPPPPPPHPAVTTGVPENRPWNLRTRRAACREPNVNSGCVSGGGGRSLRIDEGKSNFSPLRSDINKSPMRLRNSGIEDESCGAVNGGGEEKRPRVKFSVSLSRQEVEEDFMEMLGKRPPRKPKKRPKYVQKQLDALFPGLWLLEITADMYRVNENPELGK
ncbi:hypothetical protein Ancab_027768 [Ancistrocladus abbreviatus]